MGWKKFQGKKTKHAKIQNEVSITLLCCLPGTCVFFFSDHYFALRIWPLLRSWETFSTWCGDPWDLHINCLEGLILPIPSWPLHHPAESFMPRLKRLAPLWRLYLLAPPCPLHWQCFLSRFYLARSFGSFHHLPLSEWRPSWTSGTLSWKRAEKVTWATSFSRGLFFFLGIRDVVHTSDMGHACKDKIQITKQVCHWKTEGFLETLQ